MKYLIAVTRWH